MAPARIEVRGPGHHERSELAARAVAALVEAGRTVRVELDVRPRLAADIAAQLAAGAALVVLHGEGFAALAAPVLNEAALAEEHPVDVVIELRASADPLAVYGIRAALGDEAAEALAASGVPLHLSDH